jgi:hypothetical protein
MAASLGNGVYGRTHFFFGYQEYAGIGIADLGKYFGLSIHNQGTLNCGLAGGQFKIMTSVVGPSSPCLLADWQAGWPQVWRQWVQQYRPAMSVYLGRLDTVDHTFNGQWTHLGDPAFDAYVMSELRLAVSILTSDGGKVILLTSPYYSTGVDAHGRPWPENNPFRVDLYNWMLRQVAAEDPTQVYVFDLNRLLDPGGRFANVIDGQTVRYADEVHITPAGDCWLAPQFLPYVVQALTSKSAPTQPVETVDVQKAAAKIPATVCPPGPDQTSPTTATPP